MKYVIIVFGLIMVAGIGKFALENTKQIEIEKLHNSEQIEISVEKLNDSDLSLIKKLFNPKTIQSQFFSDLMDFSKKSNDVVTESNANELIVMANENISILFECLNKKNCPINVLTAERVLARHLEIVKVILKHFPMDSKDVNWIIIKEANGINNDNVKVLSLDLLRNYDAKNNGAEQILKLAAAYSGSAKADFFVNMGPDLLLDERALFTSALKESFLKDDNQTILLIVKSLKRMKLKSNEYSEIAQSLCHLKNKNDWSEISFEFKKLAINLEKLCP